MAAADGSRQDRLVFDESFVRGNLRQGRSGGAPSPTGAGWVYPGLFRAGEVWLLISETGLNRNYCGTRVTIPRQSRGLSIVSRSKRHDGSARAPLRPLKGANSHQIQLIDASILMLLMTDVFPYHFLIAAYC